MTNAQDVRRYWVHEDHCVRDDRREATWPNGVPESYKPMHLAADYDAREQAHREEVAGLVACVREAVRLASDENGEVFSGDMRARETAIIKWKDDARRLLDGGV